MGSWNSNQYSQVLNKLIKKDSKYNFFLAPNDFFPNYPLSSWKQSKRFFMKYSRAIRWIYGKLRPSIIKIVNGNNNSFQRVIDDTVNTSFKDCSAFKTDDYSKIKSQFRTDHLVFSKHYSCWPRNYKISVDHTIKELTNIGNKIYKNNSNLRFFMVPQSITFKHEQTKGRLYDYYNFPSNKAITQKGLAKYLKANLKFPLIDLETDMKNEIQKIRNNCIDCYDNFYLKYDGHLNSKAHKFLFDKYF